MGKDPGKWLISDDLWLGGNSTMVYLEIFRVWMSNYGRITTQIYGGFLVLFPQTSWLKEKILSAPFVSCLLQQPTNPFLQVPEGGLNSQRFVWGWPNASCRLHISNIISNHIYVLLRPVLASRRFTWGTWEMTLESHLYIYISIKESYIQQTCEW